MCAGLLAHASSTRNGREMYDYGTGLVDMVVFGEPPPPPRSAPDPPDSPRFTSLTLPSAPVCYTFSLRLQDVGCLYFTAGWYTEAPDEQQPLSPPGSPASDQIELRGV